MIETIHSFGYLGIFITIILEIGLLCFPLPADSLLFASGIMVEAGRMSFSVLYSVVVVASIIGGHLGYFIGQKFGKYRLQHNPVFTIDEAHFQKAHDFFERFGAVAIIFSRFVPIVRTFLSPTLGIIGYNKYNFAFYNALSSFLWATIVIFTGFFVGKRFPHLIEYVEMLLIAATVLVALPFVYEAIRRAIHKRKNKKS
jgi:membrane-associated protein